MSLYLDQVTPESATEHVSLSHVPTVAYYFDDLRFAEEIMTTRQVPYRVRSGGLSRAQVHWSMKVSKAYFLRSGNVNRPHRCYNFELSLNRSTTAITHVMMRGENWASRAQAWMFDLVWGMRNADEDGADLETQRLIRSAKYRACHSPSLSCWGGPSAS